MSHSHGVSRKEPTMSDRSAHGARANAQLLARCILLLRLSISLAQQAHATSTSRRLRRALRTARSAQRTLAREIHRASASAVDLPRARAAILWRDSEAEQERCVARLTCSSEGPPRMASE